MARARHDDALDALALVEAIGRGDTEGLTAVMRDANHAHVSLRLAMMAAQLLDDFTDGEPEAATRSLRDQLFGLEP